MKATTDDLIAHARRYGTEEVFETALADGFERKDLERLARVLRDLDSRWRGPAGWERRVADAPPDNRGCVRCGRPLSGRADRRFCSGTCQVAAYRQKRASDLALQSHAAHTKTGIEGNGSRCP